MKYETDKDAAEFNSVLVSGFPQGQGDLSVS